MSEHRLGRLALIAVALVFICNSAYAAPKKTAVKKPAPAPITNTTAKSELGSGPMVITSTSLMANRDAGTALFEGSVIAKNNDVTIHSDKMLVYYADGGAVTRIDSTGNVHFVTKTGSVDSELAVYYADQKKIIFTGNPRAVEGSNIVTGTEIIYFVELEKYSVKNSKVLFEGKKSTQ